MRQGASAASPQLDFGSLGAHIAAAGVVVGSVAMNVIVLAIVSWY